LKSAVSRIAQIRLIIDESMVGMHLTAITRGTLEMSNTLYLASSANFINQKVQLAELHKLAIYNGKHGWQTS
jgi:homoserine acetyltransferase